MVEACPSPLSRSGSGDSVLTTSASRDQKKVVLGEEVDRSCYDHEPFRTGNRIHSEISELGLDSEGSTDAGSIIQMAQTAQFERVLQLVDSCYITPREDSVTCAPFACVTGPAPPGSDSATFVTIRTRG